MQYVETYTVEEAVRILEFLVVYAGVYFGLVVWVFLKSRRKSCKNTENPLKGI